MTATMIEILNAHAETLARDNGVSRAVAIRMMGDDAATVAYDTGLDATQVRAFVGAHIEDTAKSVDGVEHSFSEWLRAAGRQDSASEFDLRAAWRAGEDPADYRR